MRAHLRAPTGGFGPGTTEITRPGDPGFDTGMLFAIVRLQSGEKIEERCAGETAWMLLDGTVEIAVDGQEARWQRGSVFDEAPSVAHLPDGTACQLEARDAVELALVRTLNTAAFSPRLFAPEQVRDEVRGADQVDGAATRTVRTVFDGSDSELATTLVLGEVIHLPGRWSSYPPHHHPQPEIYHYRFTAPQGYGHAELGEQVLKVRHGDTVKIEGGLDHAQVAAPGYGMYYIWVIRHLDGQRYDVPEFTEAHSWTLETDAKHWSPDWGRR